MEIHGGIVCEFGTGMSVLHNDEICDTDRVKKVVYQHINPHFLL
jgi:hypothetical protein